MSDLINTTKISIFNELLDKVMELLNERKHAESLVYVELVQFLASTVEQIDQENIIILQRTISHLHHILHIKSDNEE